MSSMSESLSKSFRGCFNGLGNFDIVLTQHIIPPLTQQYTPMGVYARYTTCTMYAIADSAWYIYIYSDREDLNDNNYLNYMYNIAF